MTRMVRICGLLLLLPLAGCNGPPLNSSQLVVLNTPAVHPGQSMVGEVRAFRVDRTRRIRESRSAETTDRDEERVTLQEVALGPDGRVPAQKKMAFNSQSNYGLPGLPLLHIRRTHECALCLYRPGYQTLELPSDYEQTGAVRWQVAPTPEAQVKALDRVVGRIPNLAPGSVAAAHRSALLFVAGEYERLAALLPRDNQDARPGLADNGRRLRELAAN